MDTLFVKYSIGQKDSAAEGDGVRLKFMIDDSLLIIFLSLPSGSDAGAI